MHLIIHFFDEIFAPFELDILFLANKMLFFDSLECSLEEEGVMKQ